MESDFIIKKKLNLKILYKILQKYALLVVAYNILFRLLLLVSST